MISRSAQWESQQSVTTQVFIEVPSTNENFVKSFWMLQAFFAHEIDSPVSVAVSRKISRMKRHHSHGLISDSNACLMGSLQRTVEAIVKDVDTKITNTLSYAAMP